ncbi:hypothetical protein LIA77_11983 [Sarocladium implicatum]|nr:hypothetical protein LIA77_11983 [Sarocladium implicatum]
MMAEDKGARSRKALCKVLNVRPKIFRSCLPLKAHRVEARHPSPQHLTKGLRCWLSTAGFGWSKTYPQHKLNVASPQLQLAGNRRARLAPACPGLPHAGALACMRPFSHSWPPALASDCWLEAGLGTTSLDSRSITATRISVI